MPRLVAARTRARRPIIERREVWDRAAAARAARTCYDHLAGALGVAVFRARLNQGWTVGADGRHHRHGSDRFSSRDDCAYRLTVDGQLGMAELGVALPSPKSDGTVALRYCVDWTELLRRLDRAEPPSVGQSRSRHDPADASWVAPARGTVGGLSLSLQKRDACRPSASACLGLASGPGRERIPLLADARHGIAPPPGKRRRSVIGGGG